MYTHIFTHTHSGAHADMHTQLEHFACVCAATIHAKSVLLYTPCARRHTYTATM